MKRKTIKFDLPIDGVKVKTVDQLRSHFTLEILDLFRKGILAQWLRTRNLSAELAAVEELSDDAAPERTLLALCEAFAVDADEHSVKAALARATGVAPSSSAHIERLRDGQVSSRLTPRLEAKWIFEVPVPGLVQVTVRASVDVACMLENVRGRQYATDGTVERTELPSLAAFLSRGTYCIRIRAVDEGVGEYDLQLRQATEVRTSDLNVLDSDTAVLSVKDLTTDPGRDETSSSSYGTIWERDATLPAGGADLWVVDIPGQKVRVETLGNTDTVGYLLGPDGEVLRRDDDSGRGLNFALASSKRLSGEFAVLVRRQDSLASAEDYRIRVSLYFGSDSPSLKSHGLRIVWDEFSRPDWRS